MTSSLKVIVIGLGKQSVEDHIPAIIESPMFELVAVQDTNQMRAQEIGEQYSVPWYTNLEDLLESASRTCDVALVAIPHNEYLPIIRALAERHIDVIKEKPFATSIDEANEMIRLSKEFNISIYVTLQRRFNPIFTTFEQLIKRIGKIYSIEAKYTMNIAQLDQGWRANYQLARGGALIDMGYHIVDLLVWYFGLPDEVICRLSTGNREGQQYDVEDTALVTFSYHEQEGSRNRIIGNMLISRAYDKKQEILSVYGSRGSVMIKRGRVCRRDLSGEEVEILSREGSWPSAAIDQLETLGRRIINNRQSSEREQYQYREHIAFIEAAYVSDREHDRKNPYDFLQLIEEFDTHA